MFMGEAKLVYEKDIVTKIYVQHVKKGDKVYEVPFILVRVTLPVVPFAKLVGSKIKVRVTIEPLEECR